MKQKTFLSIFIVFAILLFSQESILAQESEPTVPLKNNFMMELNFKPFGENVISFNQLQMKYKITDNFVFRLGLSFDSKTMDLPGDDYDKSEILKINGNEKLTKFGVLPGLEYHFLKNSKISPYLGLEFSYFNRSVKSHYRDYQQEYDNTGYKYIPIEIDIDGATRNVIIDYYQSSQGYYYYRTIEYPERAYKSFGGNLLGGCNFYLLRNIYVGVEVGLGYNYIQNKKVTIDISNEVNPTILPSFSTSNFGLYYNSALRLGFWF